MSRPTQTQPLPDDDDPLNPKVAASALDFLLIELVPLAQRITEQLHAREQALQEEYRRSRTFNQTASKTLVGSQQKKLQDGDGEEGQGAVGVSADGSSAAAGTGGGGDGGVGEGSGVTSLGFPVMSEKTRESVFWRLDGMGYRVGQGLVERFSLHKPRPTTPLDAIKFICKDLWTLVFRKQIDNLKTNHRGVFVLTDTRFHPLSRMSVDRRTGIKGAEEALGRAQTFLYFPCGVIRGALAGMGVEVTVEASSTEIPTATFQIKTKGAKA
ncbi:hypothetical protein LTR91_015883 [Friedmanniomyces endolithicus]|uniref:Trafficking protein particle complex subunit 6B n=1 Tax=Friedmanniomyces endolithicus TaxID=329885 RepID=A0AAN6K8Y1_9PEZI|nr:hypothetical protein LTR94_015665 [Friedmanniomyces endolithicus]KAK0790392.1 hypothetical protein LTR38_010615 [Friedmanniomyces endolithicus]KAK0790678.1 hypothetical protein LTR59_009172 [Friedmanniomyces endolithicus]KAK0797216.1 hypothetical protein LTR75_009922 [Friedmanniomyces endolithicus]KAK0836892.1 hypothetical protein LTR03_013248 [Friedmanniomyces endolithicus]